MNDIQEEMLARLKEPAMKLEKRISNTGRLMSNRELNKGSEGPLQPEGSVKSVTLPL